MVLLFLYLHISEMYLKMLQQLVMGVNTNL